VVLLYARALPKPRSSTELPRWQTFARREVSSAVLRCHREAAGVITIQGFSFLLACSEVRKGIACGATDDLGCAAVENPVSVHDLHATMPYLLGIDASKLAVKYHGLDVRLTGLQGGNVVRDIIA